MLLLRGVAFVGRSGALLGLLGQGGAQDLAQRGARVGRTVIGHRLLLFLFFLRLDRERQAAGRLVDRADLGIDLLADGEAVGALLGTVARELAAADEAGDD